MSNTNRTDGPVSGAKIKHDKGPVIPAVSNTDLVSAANKRVLKDTGLQLNDTKYGDSTTQKEADKFNRKHDNVSFGQLLSSKTTQGIYQGLDTAIDIGNQFIDRDLTKNPTGFDAQQNIGNALIKSGNPYAAIAGVAYKALSGVAEQFGGNVNTINKDQANEVGLSK